MPMKHQERVFENPGLKDRVTLVKTAEETNGEYLLVKSEVAPHGGVPMHYHVTFTEKFEVLEGQLHVIVAGQHRVLEAGQTALAPLKAPHRFYNPSEMPVTSLIEIRPARHIEKGLRVLYGLAGDGKVNSKGFPASVWHLALLLQLTETYVPGVPLFVQRRIFGALASIAKWKGEDKALQKYL